MSFCCIQFTNVCVLLPWIDSSDGADETPVPFCPAQGAVLVKEGSHGNNREHNKVSWKFIILRGLANFCQFSFWENNSSPSTRSFAKENKKITENGTLLIYCIYFFCTFIYRLIYSNRFFSRFRAFLLIG